MIKSQKTNQNMDSSAVPKKSHKGKRKMSREEKSMQYKTFIGNKAEGQGFADKRKRQIMYKYTKDRSKVEQDLALWKTKLQKMYDEDSDSEDEMEKKRKRKLKEPKVVSENETSEARKPKIEDKRKTKLSVFHKEEKLQQEKKQKQEEKKKEFEARAKAKSDAQEKYQKEKRRKHKVLSKKNFKGQPNLTARMDLLLEKIEKLREPTTVK